MMERPFSEDDLRAFVSGAADAELAAEITSRIDSDPEFRAEVAVLGGVKSLFSEDAMNHQPDELGWRRLEARIRNEQQQTVPQAANSNFWRVAAAACGLVIVLQGAYIFANSGPGGDARYETATATEQAHVLALGFVNDAAIGEVSDSLRALDGTVIGGPSALGLYRVSFPTVEALNAAQEVLSGTALVSTIAKE